MTTMTYYTDRIVRVRGISSEQTGEIRIQSHTCIDIEIRRTKQKRWEESEEIERDRNAFNWNSL